MFPIRWVWYPISLLVMSNITNCAIGDLVIANCAIGGIPLLGLTHPRTTTPPAKPRWWCWQHNFLPSQRKWRSQDHVRLWLLVATYTSYSSLSLFPCSKGSFLQENCLNPPLPLAQASRRAMRRTGAMRRTTQLPSFDKKRAAPWRPPTLLPTLITQLNVDIPM